MKAAAIDSATGWTVVEPASVIVPDSSLGLVGVGLGLGVGGAGAGVVGSAGVGVVVGAGVVTGGLGLGGAGVVGADCAHPANAITRTSITATGNMSRLIFLIINDYPYFLIVTKRGLNPFTLARVRPSSRQYVNQHHIYYQGRRLR